MKTLPALAFCTATMLTTVAPPALAQPPFEYKGDRPGVTTLAEFRRTHTRVVDEKNYEMGAYTICNHPMKNDAYITELTFCNSRETYEGVSAHYEFVGNVLSYMSVYFAAQNYRETLRLLQEKYGTPAKTINDVVRTEGGASFPFVAKKWENESSGITLRDVSDKDIDKASVEVADFNLSSRYDKLASTAAI